MKKFIIFLLAMLVFSTAASAEMDFDLSADADKIVSTSANLSYGEAIKIIVLNEGADINNLNESEDVFYFGVLTPGSDSSQVNTEINMDGAEGKKRYAVYSIVASGLAETNLADGIKYIGYDTLSNRNRSVENIKTALYNDEDSSDVEALFEDEVQYMGINLTLYDLASLNETAKIMVKDKTTVSFNGQNDLTKMINFINNSMLVDVLNGTNADKVSLEYLMRVINESEDYSEIRELFAGIDSAFKANVLNDIKNKNCATYGELKQLIKNAVVINAFNYTDTGAENLFKMLDANKDITTPRLDLSKLKALGYADRMTATQAIAHKKYKTIAELCEALSMKLTDETIQNAPSGGGGGGGGGGLGGGSSSGKGSEQAIKTPVSEGIKVYTDMGEYKWAEDALYYLTQTNVISGYGNGEFRPQNNITRAEFVKIVAGCFFEENTNTNKKFDDVDDNMWYSKYIKTALANGIISGVSETQFCPDEYITRQDMAVVLYNTAMKLNFEVEQSVPAITDDALISDYAKNAVYTLKSIGIINGYDDGSFKPANYANRAETVQMIYNFLMKKGEYIYEY